MKVQHQSDGVQHGEGPTHLKAKFKMIDILEKQGWQVFPETKLIVWFTLQSQDGRLNINNQKQPAYMHAYDLYCEKSHSNRLVSKMFLEIDGEIHTSNKYQKNRDIKAQQYAEHFFPNTEFKRIEKFILLDKGVTENDVLTEIGLLRDKENKRL